MSEPMTGKRLEAYLDSARQSLLPSNGSYSVEVVKDIVAEIDRLRARVAMLEGQRLMLVRVLQRPAEDQEYLVGKKEAFDDIKANP